MAVIRTRDAIIKPTDVMIRAGGEFNCHAGDTAGCWTAVVVGNLEYGVPTKPGWSVRVCGLRVTDGQIVAA